MYTDRSAQFQLCKISLYTVVLLYCVIYVCYSGIVYSCIWSIIREYRHYANVHIIATYVNRKRNCNTCNCCHQAGHTLLFVF